MARREREIGTNRTEIKENRRQRPKKPVGKKRGGILGKIVCLLLGFILGIVGTIGGVAGLGYYVVAGVKIKDAINTVGDLSGAQIEYTDFVTEEYGEKTTLELVMDMADAFGDLGSGEASLSTLEKFSPMLRNGIDNLATELSNNGIHIDVDVLMETPLKEMEGFIQDTINSIEIAPIIEKATGNKVEGLLAAICYGEEGEDYVWGEDGKIVYLGESGPTTIGTLSNSESLNDRLNGLSFHTLMSAMGNGEINADDPIIRTLVYGVEDKDYVFDENDEIVPLPKTYDLDSITAKFVAPDETEFIPTSTDGIWTDANGNTIVSREDTAKYHFDVKNSKGVVISSLKFLAIDEEAGTLKFQSYIDDVAQVRKGPYLSDVMGKDADLLGVVGEVRLGDLLKLDGDSDSVMLAVAYGEKDKDYTIDSNNQIVPLEGGKDPVTINDMIDGDGTEIIKDVPLATVLEIESPLDDSVDSLMIILAYGEEDTHYRTYVENGVKKWAWLEDPETGKPYSERTIGYLMDDDTDGESIFDELTIATLLNVDHNSDALMRAIAFGNENIHYQLVDKDSDGNIDKVEMLPKKYVFSATAPAPVTVYDEEHFVVGTLGNKVGENVYEVIIDSENDVKQYIAPAADGGYYVYATAEDVTNPDARLLHTKTLLKDLRGDDGSFYIERIELATVLEIDIFGEGENTPDPMMLALAYGNEGENGHYTLDRVNKVINWNVDPATGLHYHARTVNDMKDANKLIDDIYLDTALALTSSSPEIMLSLAFGNDYVKNTDGTVVPGPSGTRNTIGDLKGDGAKSLIDDIEMHKLFDEPAEGHGAIMNYILYNDTKADPSSANYKVRKLGDFTSNSSAIIDGMMDTLTLHEALGDDVVNSDKILQQVADTPLNEIGDALHVLSIQKVLVDDIYYYAYYSYDEASDTYTYVREPDPSDPDDATNAEAAGLIKVLSLPQYVNHVIVGYIPVFESAPTTAIVEGEEVTYRNYVDQAGNPVGSPLQGCWKYLLVDAKTGLEREFALESMDSATTNMIDNMQTATLNALHEDGLLTVDPTTLDHDIIYSFDIAGTNHVVTTPYYYLDSDGNPTTQQKQTIGELTVKESTSYISKMLLVIDEIRD